MILDTAISSVWSSHNLFFDYPIVNKSTIVTLCKWEKIKIKSKNAFPTKEDRTNREKANIVYQFDFINNDKLLWQMLTILSMKMIPLKEIQESRNFVQVILQVYK